MNALPLLDNLGFEQSTKVLADLFLKYQRGEIMVSVGMSAALANFFHAAHTNGNEKPTPTPAEDGRGNDVLRLRPSGGYDILKGHPSSEHDSLMVSSTPHGYLPDKDLRESPQNQFGTTPVNSREPYDALLANLRGELFRRKLEYTDSGEPSPHPKDDRAGLFLPGDPIWQPTQNADDGLTYQDRQAAWHEYLHNQFEPVRIDSDIPRPNSKDDGPENQTEIFDPATRIR
ncbi:hypothetical protein [Pseudomonas sp. D2002]|uniref:hypothetical protein n=1 Tax=Pseudomonas sp. D2002 TaxID=2726980 RepID=UPI0015A2CC9F|nr:hypothetical protein [Pseudomonas sp. D2002]NWA81756.1 hypothetical protein [Pseudomonas sp. D2002]